MAETGEIFKFSVRVPVVETNTKGERKVVGEKFIEPFKGKKNFPPYKWCKDADVFMVQIRFVEAVFSHIEKDHTAVDMEGKVIDTFNKAFFTDLSNGRQYDIATDALPRGLKEGTVVKLTMLGCCSIIGIEAPKSKPKNSKKKIEDVNKK